MQFVVGCTKKPEGTLKEFNFFLKCSILIIKTNIKIKRCIAPQLPFIIPFCHHFCCFAKAKIPPKLTSSIILNRGFAPTAINIRPLQGQDSLSIHDYIQYKLYRSYIRRLNHIHYAVGVKQ